MPAIGDQHRLNGAGVTTNPFEDQKPRMSEYTAQEIATLQSRLDKQLGPEYISSRPGAGGKKVHYLAADKVIGLANEVFGFNGWSSSIQNVQIDFVEENPTNGKVRLGLSVIVRVTLKDGTYHEDIGYGQIDNCPGKAAAFEKCKKEGTTDALKRALRSFGNVLGNCIYDKDFLQRVIKVKYDPARWNPDTLHRHADYAPVKKEVQEENSSKNTTESGDVSNPSMSDEFDDAFDEADFGEHRFGNPDEFVLEAEPVQQRPTANGTSRPVRGDPRTSAPYQPNAATPSKPPRPSDNAAQAAHIERQRQQAIERRNATLAAQRMQPPANAAPGAAQVRSAPIQVAQQQQHTNANQNLSSPGVPSLHFSVPNQPLDPSLAPMPIDQVGSHGNDLPPDAPVSFLSARAIAAPNTDSATSAASAQFNPHAESPSIRKTAGIDHTRSGKIARDSLTGKPIALPPSLNEAKQQGQQQPHQNFPPPMPPTSAVSGPTAIPRDFVNPSADPHRRIGSPMPAQSMTKSYRPPTFKRPASDMSTSTATTTTTAVTSTIAAGVGGRQPLSDVANVQGRADGVGDSGGLNKKVKVTTFGNQGNENGALAPAPP